jgi:hypothetical protein
VRGGEVDDGIALGERGGEIVTGIDLGSDFQVWIFGGAADEGLSHAALGSKNAKT